jgi:hypothetical protein
MEDVVKNDISEDSNIEWKMEVMESKSESIPNPQLKNGNDDV